jgi:hypothetical protein
MSSLFDDPLLSLRLRQQPEFLLRLAEFLQSYRVSSSALVLQARPAQHLQGGLNVGDPELQKRFLAGAASDDGWWQGFRAMCAVTSTFHGIAGLPSREDPHWAIEAHHDGHFIAGVWEFPTYPAGDSSVRAVAEFFVEMFSNFFHVVASTLHVADGTLTYETTATLVKANDLHYVTDSRFRMRMLSKPLAIENLQWPIASASVGSEDWAALGQKMGIALTGAYGDTAPRKR